MKAHLGNPNCHTNDERQGIIFKNKVETKVRERKVRIQKKVVRRRKKVRIKEKLSFVKLVLEQHDLSENRFEIDDDKDAVSLVVESLRDQGIILRKDALKRYVQQRDRLQRRYGEAKYRVAGAGVSPDSFLVLKKSFIEESLLIVRRIPNVTMEIFFEYVSRKYPE